jgi:hypothetical protein
MVRCSAKGGQDSRPGRRPDSSKQSWSRVSGKILQKSGMFYMSTFDKERFFIGHVKRTRSCIDICCDECRKNLKTVMVKITSQLKKLEMRYMNLVRGCSRCIGANSHSDIVNECQSIDCAHFYDRVKTKRKLQKVAAIHEKVQEW